MNPERWQKIETLFQSVLDCQPAERASVLAQLCSGDEGLRAEVESLIASHDEAGGFFDSPAFEDGIKVFMNESGEQMTGASLGRYRVIREIGRGGMGAVYLAAREDDYQKQVAVKLIKRGMDTDFILARFRNERQILANLDHPNIARLFDGGTTEDGRPYFVMEYIEGQPIDEYCDSHQLTIEERLKLFRKACAAVIYAHQHLVVHRDIKPGNVLVTKDGEPKLLDFGIAKLLDREQSDEHTATRERVLTPEYASPEQVRGSSVTTSSDIYSLGVILYQLLTGRRPYQIKSKLPSDVARAVCEEQPEKPSTAISRKEENTDSESIATTEGISQARASQPEKLHRRLKGDLDNIVLMALRKETERRYPSVEKFSEDIRRHQEGLPVIAHKDTFAYRGAKFIRRNKVAVAAAMLVAITLVVGIAATLWQARIATREAKIAAAERDRARIEQIKAERINRFLQDTIGFADPGAFSPGAGRGLNATVGDALNEASERAESELADQPEVLAGVLRTIGTAYLNLGQFDLAEHSLRASLDLNRKIYGEDHAEVGRSLNLAAEPLLMKGNYAAAEQFDQQALAIFRRHSSDGSVPPLWVVGALNDLGLLTMTKGDPAGGEKFLRESVALSSQFTGNDRAALAIALGNLGQARVAQGDFNEAETFYRQSIDEYRKLQGRERLELATSLNYLGDVLRIKGKYTEAEKALRESLEIARRLVGETNGNVALASQGLALVLYAEGKYADAEKAVNESISIAKQLLPEGHIGFSGPLTILGLIQNRTGRSAQAEKTLREALSIRERILPKGHWQIAYTKGALGECLMTEKRYSEAEPLLKESYNDLAASQGAENPRTVEARNRLEQLYKAWGKRS